MKNGGRAYLEEDVTHALLGHIERLRRVENPLVELRQAVEVLAQKRHVVRALDQRHRAHLYTTTWPRRNGCFNPGTRRRKPPVGAERRNDDRLLTDSG